MAAIAAERDLLFGLLALQNGLISQVQLVAAFQAWTLDKACALADHLVVRGDLDADDRSAIEALVARHIKKHGGDVERSLAAIPAGRSTCESLARIDDSDVGGTLAHLVLASTHDGDHADRTASYSVGEATSAGQRFRVLRPHARGGLGAVFVALDAELHREVALKQILDTHADDPISRQRFLLEAEVTGGLEHPGIVPVYGLGTYSDGRPYYAMRFIKGDSLKEAIDRFHKDEALKAEPGRRSLEQRKLLRRFTDVCNAIDYAHSRGVLHRDIKPGNIIVGKHGETLVVDWGLAKPLGRAEPGSDAGERTLVPSSASGSASTLPGSALGTPAYMSPEQASGDLDRLGPRSDVYALGATLNCLLTGRPPFEGEDIGEVIRKVQRGEFAPPRKLDPSIDPALEAVCLKAMATKPEDRYATSRDLADDVERWMADEPVTAWREPILRQARRWARRHRTGVTSAAMALVVALAGAAAVLAVQSRANRELKRANRDLAGANSKVTQANTDLAASNERERARFALAQEAIRMFHTGVSEDMLLKERQFQKLRNNLLGRAADFYGKLERLLKDQPDLRSQGALAVAYCELANLTRSIGSSAKALVLAHQAVSLQQSLAVSPVADPASKHTLLDLLIIEGRLQQATDDYIGAEKTLQEGAKVGEELVRTRRSRGVHQSLARCYMALAANDADLSRPGEAIAANARAIAILNPLVDEDPRDLTVKNELANAHFSVGYVLSVYMNSPLEALEAVEHARSIERSAVAADPASEEYRRVLSEMLNMLGALQLAQGKVDAALATLEEGRGIIEKLVAAEPNVTMFQNIHSDILGNLGLVLAKKGDLAGAIDAERKCAGIIGKLSEANRDDRLLRRQWGASYNNVGDFELAAGKTDEALASYTRARELIEPLVTAQPRAEHYKVGLAFSLAGLGRAHTRLGSFAKSVAELRAASSIWERTSMSTIESQYVNAGCHAILAGLGGVPGSGLSARDAEREVMRAVDLLKGPMSAGYRSVAELLADQDFRALRGRADFEKLIGDVSFPRDPFAPSN